MTTRTTTMTTNNYNNKGRRKGLKRPKSIDITPRKQTRDLLSNVLVRG